jgi:hypothetical protein
MRAKTVQERLLSSSGRVTPKTPGTDMVVVFMISKEIGTLAVR